MVAPYDCTKALETIAHKMGFCNAESLPLEWKWSISDEIRAAERRGWDRGFDDARKLYGSMTCR